jgi:hypothetical protein
MQVNQQSMRARKTDRPRKTETMRETETIWDTMSWCTKCMEETIIFYRRERLQGIHWFGWWQAKTQLESKFLRKVTKYNSCHVVVGF